MWVVVVAVCRSVRKPESVALPGTGQVEAVWALNLWTMSPASKKTRFKQPSYGIPNLCVKTLIKQALRWFVDEESSQLVIDSVLGTQPTRQNTKHLLDLCFPFTNCPEVPGKGRWCFLCTKESKFCSFIHRRTGNYVITNFKYQDIHSQSLLGPNV